MDFQDKKFDPHSLLPKDHPMHPEQKGKAEEQAEKSAPTPDVHIQPEPTHTSTQTKVDVPSITSTPAVEPVKTSIAKNETSQSAFTTQKKSSPLLKILAVVLFVLFIGGLGIYLWMNGYLTQLQVLSPMGPLSPVAGVAESVKPVEVGDMNTWKTYTSASQGFTIRHPGTIVPTEFTEGNQAVTVFTLVGPTQKKDTEFYDGISLQFMSGELGGQTLEEFAEDEAAEISQHAKVTKQPAAVTVSGINGYEFSAEGVGEVTFIYLPDGGAYLKIANLTKDPTNQGYQKIVTDMLTTLRFTEEGNPEANTVSPEAER